MLAFDNIVSSPREVIINTNISNNMEKITVTIPPGKLGIHLKDSQSDNCSTIVSSVSDSSPLAGKIFRGDQVIGINDVNVRDMGTTGMNS